MANGRPIKELWGEATCPVCLEFFKEPMILSCGHNFCRACLVKHWRASDIFATCPQCQRKCLQNSILPNRQLANIVEVVKQLHKGERHEGKCEKLQEKVQKWNNEDDRAMCMLCDRFKKNQPHAVLSVEEASRGHKASCSEVGTQSMAELPKLFEHFQQQGLSIGRLSVKDLVLLLIQHNSQPDPELAKVKPKKIQPQQQEHEAQEGCDPKEKEPFQVLEKTGEEQVAAQAQVQKQGWECWRWRNTQLDENIPRFFSLKGNTFLSNSETAAQTLRGPRAEAHVVCPPPLLRGEVEKVPDPYDFKAPMSVVTDHFSQQFFTLRRQKGTAFHEFGAKLHKALNNWMDAAKADNREKVLNVILLQRFFSQLPPDIRRLVKAEDPQDVSCAAEMADHLRIKWRA